MRPVITTHLEISAEFSGHVTVAWDLSLFSSSEILPMAARPSSATLGAKGGVYSTAFALFVFIGISLL